MVVRATKINPEMLRWARESSGYTVEDIARRRRVSPERVLQWEAGESFPTWRQLEQLAYQDYHRGTLLFLLDAPPDEKTVAEEFPRLPSALLSDLAPDTMYAVRQARIRQEDLAEILGTDVVAERFILRDLREYANVAGSDQLVLAVREYLGANFDDLDEWSENSYTFEHWRSLIEDVGIWVFKRSFRQKDIAGFCLGNARHPVIYVCNGQPKNRQIFTLFNHLAHLLFDFNYLERADEEYYTKSLPSEERGIENACISLAKAFAPHISDLAGRSYDLRGVAALRPKADRRPADALRSAPDNSKNRGYYDLQKVYLGRRYIDAVLATFDAGHIDELDIAPYLGVKRAHLDKLRRHD